MRIPVTDSPSLNARIVQVAVVFDAFLCTLRTHAKSGTFVAKVNGLRWIFATARWRAKRALLTRLGALRWWLGRGRRRRATPQTPTPFSKGGHRSAPCWPRTNWSQTNKIKKPRKRRGVNEARKAGQVGENNAETGAKS